MIIWHKINNSSHLEALNELQPSVPLLPFIQGDPLTSPYSRTGCGYRIRSTSSWGAFTSGPGRNCNVSMATWSNQHPSWWFIPSLNQVQRDGRRLRVKTRQVWHKNYGCYWLLVITDNYTLHILYIVILLPHESVLFVVKESTLTICVTEIPSFCISRRRRLPSPERRLCPGVWEQTGIRPLLLSVPLHPVSWW